MLLNMAFKTILVDEHLLEGLLDDRSWDKEREKCTLLFLTILPSKREMDKYLRETEDSLKRVNKSCQFIIAVNILLYLDSFRAF